MKSLATILLLAIVGTSATFAAGSGAVPIFESRYAAMKLAMASRDGKAIASLLAPDFTSVDVSGKTETGAEMINEVAALPVDPNKVSQTTILSATTTGNTATVSQRYDMKTTKTAADGTAKNVELVTLSTDTWTKSGGTWLLQRTVTKQIDYFVNGQAVLHKTAAP